MPQRWPPDAPGLLLGSSTAQLVFTAPHSRHSCCTAADTDDEVALSSGQMGKTEAVEKLKELLGDELVAQLQDAAWKTRLEAMEALLERAKAPELAASGCALAQAIAHVPGWDEKNFQVRSVHYQAFTIHIRLHQICKSAVMCDGGRDQYLLVTDAMQDIVQVLAWKRVMCSRGAVHDTLCLLAHSWVALLAGSEQAV